MSFVYNDGTLPEGKVDVARSNLPANQTVTATEWNTTMQAVKDLRAAMLALTDSSGVLKPAAVAVALETQSELDIYVSPTGNDSDVGDPGTPLRQIHTALDRIPKRIRHRVQIHVAAGTYEGFKIEGFSYDPDPSRHDAGLIISGEYVTATLATGTATGTFTGSVGGDDTAPRFTTATQAGQTWTVNNLKGRLCEILTGGSAGSLIPIVSNTATTLTLADNFSSISNGDTYAIRDHGVKITTAISTPNALFSLFFLPFVDPEQHGVLVRNNKAGFNILIEGIQVDVAIPFGGQAWDVNNNDGLIQLNYCKCTNSADGFRLGPDTGVGMQGCISNMNSGFFGMLVAGKSTGATINGCLITSPGSRSSGIGVQCQEASANVSLVSTRIDNYIFGIKILGSSGFVLELDGVSIDTGGGSQAILASALAHGNYGGTIIHAIGLECNNCSTALQLGGLNQAWCDSFKGTGNTIGIQLDKGARCQLSSTSTITGATEISLDGVSHTLTALRAASPKLFTNTYGTIVFE